MPPHVPAELPGLVLAVSGGGVPIEDPVPVGLKFIFLFYMSTNHMFSIAQVDSAK